MVQISFQEWELQMLHSGRTLLFQAVCQVWGIKMCGTGTQHSPEAPLAHVLMDITFSIALL